MPTRSSPASPASPFGRAAPTATPLDVLADLSMVVGGDDVRIEAEGDRIVVNLSSLRAGTSLLSLVPLQGGQGRQQLGRINDALRMAGLTVDVRVQGDTLVRLGANAQRGAVGRLLRLGDVEVRPGRAVAGAARRNRGLTWAIGGGVAGLLTLLYFWRRD